MSKRHAITLPSGKKAVLREPTIDQLTPADASSIPYHSEDIHRVFGNSSVQVWEKQLTEHSSHEDNPKVLAILGTVVFIAIREEKLIILRVTASTPEGLSTEATQSFSVGFEAYWNKIDRKYVSEVFDVLQSFKNG